MHSEKQLTLGSTPLAQSRSAWLAAQWTLLLVLVVGLGLRMLLWGNLPRAGWISDEGEYFSAATWLAEGRGFSWYQQYLWTRAPIYPLFVALHLRLFGDTLAPIYLTQTVLSLVNVVLVYALARQLTPGARTVPTLAALLMALYFPFAVYTQVLLSETLFITLLLGGFWTLTHLRFTIYDLRFTIAAGILFGLATLTRSLTLLFLPIVAIWILARTENQRGDKQTSRQGNRAVLWFSGSSVLCSFLFVLCSFATIAPWTIYNSRLYGGLVVVDTSGAYNLLLGARTAYDGKRDDAPPRDFVLGLFEHGRPSTPPEAKACAQPYPGVLQTQAARQTAMTREGLCLIVARPLAFASKSLGEFVDLFQINYGGDERFTDDFALGRLPRWYAVALFLLDDTLFVLTLPLAVVGWALARKRLQIADCRLQIMPDHTQSTIYNLQSAIGLWWLYNLAVAPLLFAINRFRLPLLPFAFIFAAYALVALRHGGWRQLLAPGVRAWSGVAALLFLVAATPYAYLEPRPAGAPSRWASYLGPYPSSFVSTVLAWRHRPAFLATEQLQQALHNNDAAMAQSIIASGDVLSYTLDFAQPLLLGAQGHYNEGLALLPLDDILQNKDVQRAVARGDLLRSTGDTAGAKAILGQRFVDDANPVAWAWDWLHPAPTKRIDIADDLDLGYINGCYLGEYDPDLRVTVRWCSDGAQLRFPGAGTGAPQTLVLHADRRGWPDDRQDAGPVRVFVNQQEIGTFLPNYTEPKEFAVALSPTPIGADVVVTLRTPTFVPAADRYLSQQGKQVVGQVQRLGARLDWAELREASR